MPVREHLDVLIVGGGSAGSAAAAFLAEQGRSVLVADRRGPDRAGARWVNGVPRWCFERARVELPEPPERFGDAHAFVVGVEGSDVRVRVATGDAVHVDMRGLVERLTGRATRAGARFVEASVAQLTSRAGRVAEVELQGAEGPISVAPRLVVDASGLAGVVRRRVPELAAACPPVAEIDLCAAAEHQHVVRDEAGLRAFLAAHGAEPGDSVGFLGTAGGYSTLTLFTEPSCREVGVLTGSVRAQGHPSGAALLRRFVREQAWIGERLYGGQGAIPLRRPYARLVAPGVALVGDAACQVYAAHGSGVGMGLMAARMLSDALVRHSDPGASSGLRGYERSFHLEHGGLLAGSDAFRRFSQSLERADVEELLRSGLLDEELLATGLAQVPARLRPRWLAGKTVAVWRSPRAASRVAPAVARVVLLQALLSRLAPPRSRAGTRVFDRLVAALVGPTPPAPLERPSAAAAEVEHAPAVAS